jgi:hypothetical protein
MGKQAGEFATCRKGPVNIRVIASPRINEADRLREVAQLNIRYTPQLQDEAP